MSVGNMCVGLSLAVLVITGLVAIYPRNTSLKTQAGLLLARLCIRAS